MQPHLQIRCIAPRLYAYSLSAGGAPTQLVEETTLESLERCLGDAGDSLGAYFASVQISIEGRLLGSFAVGLVQRNAMAVASQLREKLIREHRRPEDAALPLP
ncbi:hypothetical protein QTH89_06000 [Variovorax sp. J22G21]|uniref:hypothetical protein n=1 Tax=Variovorax fucosicus TaxID=3053517 RepID=UPI002577E37D|nr:MULTISPECIES: hypothetical protein [unclassified Variovorax]MDM0041701.1 hypothetical protein [Variovorax sp. J22R193]MDM0060757.1 hypothetical protein [Variovorax sp. J22G21]